MKIYIYLTYPLYCSHAERIVYTNSESEKDVKGGHR